MVTAVFVESQGSFVPKAQFLVDRSRPDAMAIFVNYTRRAQVETPWNSVFDRFPSVVLIANFRERGSKLGTGNSVKTRRENSASLDSQPLFLGDEHNLDCLDFLSVLVYGNRSAYGNRLHE